MCSCKMGAGAGQNALEITAPSPSPSLVRSCIPSLTSLNPGSSSCAVCLTTLLYCRIAGSNQRCEQTLAILSESSGDL